jgi:alkylation response protein AidB-like acyl-CoA dehydrogenase
MTAGHGRTATDTLAEADTDTAVSTYRAGLRDWLAAHRAELAAHEHRRTGGIAAAVEHDGALLAALYDAGWSRWGWAREIGGLGGPVLLRAVLYDELAAADVELPEAFVILETLGPALQEYAPALAARHLGPYLTGTQMWGQGFSEPGAGSDLAHLRTRAAPVAGGYRLDGHKTWMTLGQFAGFSAVLARTGTPESAHRGLTMFWVDLAATGVTVRPIRAANGRDEFAEVYFDGVHVPDDAVIGEVGGGWAVAMFLLQYERGMYAWLRQAVLHRRLRALAGRAATAEPPALAALGTALVDVTVLRAKSARTVRLLSDGQRPGPDISVDKVLLATAEQSVFDAARRLGWPAMVSSVDDQARTLREEWFYSRASSIFGGAIDIQRDVLARLVLDLPRG